MSSTTETRRLAFPTVKRPCITQVSYGLGFAEACLKYIKEDLDAKRVLIIASNSLYNNTRHVQRLQAVLGSLHAGTSTGIKAHTSLSDLVPIIQQVNQKNIDCIITVGGSSLADGAQIIALAVASGAATVDELRALHVRGAKTTAVKPSSLPLVFVPTTLSSGEYSKYGGGTDPDTREKCMYAHDSLYARLIVMDPALTTTTPMWVWLSTGVRAIDHCVEGILSTKATPENDKACVEALPLLIPSLIRTKEDPMDLEARVKAMQGANLSMTGLAEGVDKGASHGIGHQLGPLGVGHGETSCILLPAVCKYNSRVNADRQQFIKELLWDQPIVTQLLKERGLAKGSNDLGDVLDAVFRKLGMPRTLKEVNIGRDKFAVIAHNSARDSYCLANPIPLKTPEQVTEILEMVLGDYDTEKDVILA